MNRRTAARALAGIVVSTRVQQTRSGRLAVIVLDDGTATVEATAFPELFDANRELVKEDRPVVVLGKVTKDEFGGGFRVRAEKIFDLGQARSRYARQMLLRLNGQASREGQAAVKRLRNLLSPYRNGPCPVSIQYANGAASVELRLGEDWRVSLHDQLIADLQAWLAPENVEIFYQ